VAAQIGSEARIAGEFKKLRLDDIAGAQIATGLGVGPEQAFSEWLAKSEFRSRRTCSPAPTT
jgi:hypothetical protein